MSNYKSWDLYSLIARWVAWKERARESPLSQQRHSYEGELSVIEAEINERFFTGPYFPANRPSRTRRA